MAATLTDIRGGIKARLETIAGLHAFAVEPAAPPYPAAWCIPLRASFSTDFDGATAWTIGVTVAVSAQDLGRAQTNLDPYLAADGTKSLKSAIEGEPTLGGVVDYARVTGITGYFSLAIAGGSAVGATIEVEVLS